MKRKSVVLIAVVVGALTLSVTLIYGNSRGPAHPATASSGQQPPEPVLVAGPGRVEPASEDIKLGAELSGKLKTVNVEEGDPVRRGQVLAELQNDDYKAQVASAEAEVSAKEAALRKVINGARSQERAEAFSSVREAEAVMNNARSEMERRRKLFAAGVISREEAERYARQYDVAEAQYHEAVQRHSLVDAHAREEDRSLAEADLDLARARLAQARALYAKTLITSPIDGTVLRKHHRTGESVSNSSTVPDPILTIGDKRRLRVRVEVDETEVSKVCVGQSAYVTADAFGAQKFWGRVIRVGEELGRKNIRTDEPTERVDTKILETLVELDPGVQLPMGLRVDAFIVTSNEGLAAMK
ncbi:MAG: HlyD family secretion protein [Terriglobales bacterium]